VPAAGDWKPEARPRRPDWALAGPPRYPAAHSAESPTCRVAAREVAIAPTREAARRAPAEDGWALAARGPAAIPALPPRHRGSGSHGECCQAGAATDPKRYCRSARARAAQPKSRWRPTMSRDRSGQWFEAFRGFKLRGSKRRIGLATLRAVADARVNTPNTAGQGRLPGQTPHWPGPGAAAIVPS